MQGLVTRPGVAGSTHVGDVAGVKAAAGEVLLRVLEVGVCGTDREISEGSFGVAPENRPSVTRATDSPRPAPTTDDVMLSISRIPGPPAGPS